MKHKIAIRQRKDKAVEVVIDGEIQLRVKAISFAAFPAEPLRLCIEQHTGDYTHTVRNLPIETLTIITE